MNRKHKRRIVPNDICTAFTSQFALSTVAKSLASCFLFRKSRIQIRAQRPVYLKLNKASFFPCHFEIPCSFFLSLKASSHCLRYCDQCTVRLPTGPDSPKASSPHSAIDCFLFQFPVPSRFLKTIQQLRMPSSSPSRHFYPSLYISFNSVL